MLRGVVAPRAAHHVGRRHASLLSQLPSLEDLRQQWPKIAFGTGAAVVTYGAAVVVYDLAYAVTHMNIETVYMYGIETGVGMSLIAAAGLLTLRNRVTLRSEAVFRIALAKLAKSEVVTTRLGPHLRAGSLRAYTTVPAHLALSGWRPRVVAPHTSMLFHVLGEWGEGMATVECLKDKGRVKISLLALDVAARQGKPTELVMVTGNEERLHVVGTLRGFLQGDRAAYIPQDKVMEDEELLREQEALPEEGEAEGGEAEATHTPGGAGGAR